MSTPTLTEIAERIAKHLRRFEANDEINQYEDGNLRLRGLRPYYMAGAHRAGSYVGVRYIAYQGSRNLTKDVAIGYLAWLDAGNVGKHDDYQKEKALKKEKVRS